jgi:hypothetical protein
LKDAHTAVAVKVDIATTLSIGGQAMMSGIAVCSNCWQARQAATAGKHMPPTHARNHKSNDVKAHQQMDTNMAYLLMLLL